MNQPDRDPEDVLLDQQLRLVNEIRLLKGLGFDEKEQFHRIEEQVLALRRTPKAVTGLVDLFSVTLKKRHNPYLRDYALSMIKRETEFNLDLHAFDEGHLPTLKELFKLKGRDPRSPAGRVLRKLQDHRPRPKATSRDTLIKVTAGDMADAMKFMSALRELGAEFGSKEVQSNVSKASSAYIPQ